MLSFLRGGFSTKHSPSFVMSRKNGLDHYLLLLVKTKGEFTIGDKNFSVMPNSIIIFDRNVPYEYSNPGACYMDDWIHFDTTCDDEFRSCGIIFNEPCSVSNPSIITSYIQQILWEENYTDEKFKHKNIDMLLHVLINNLILAYEKKDRFKQYSPYNTRLKEFRLSLLTAPYEKYTPQDAADSMSISVSYFQHLYKDFFGISFQADLINIRIEYVKQLLTTTTLSIEQICEHCGYISEVHFYRQFRKKTGMTPLMYRNAH